MRTPGKELIRLNLADPRLRGDHHLLFSELRDRGPLIPARLSLIGRVWLVTRHAGVNACLRDAERFVRDPRNAGRKQDVRLQLIMPRMFDRLSKNMLGADGDAHRRLRMLVDKAFSRQNIQHLESEIERISRQLLEQLPVDENGVVDLVEHFCQPLPLIVICQLLGLPDSDRPRFMKWFEGFSSASNLWAVFRLVPNLRRTMRYLEHQFREVRRSSRPGLIHDLVEAEMEGDRLSHEELLSMAMLLLLAGHETTVHLISTSVLTLFQLPDVRQRLVQDPQLLESCVDEMLRYNSPVQFTKPRFAAVDCEFYGQTLKRGDSLVPLLASANGDPEVFEAADQFRIDRHPNRHLAFGAGPHVCLGLKLARAETMIALRTLLHRYPDLGPGFDLAHPHWSRRGGMRALKSMPVRPGGGGCGGGG